MQPTFEEEWKLQMGRKEYIINAKERDMILNAGENRFVRFRDLIVNPAFVSDIVFIKKVIKNQLPSGPVHNLTQEEIDRTSKIREEIRNKIKTF